MYFIGSLKDKSKASEIVEVLKSKGIDSCFVEGADFELTLSCFDKEQANEAQLIFLQMMGLVKYTHQPDPEYFKIKNVPMMPVTLFLILTSTSLFCLKYFFSKEVVFQYFTMSNNQNIFLQEVRLGEVHRLLTPILLHFSFMHILFNLLWLKDLGKIIEKKLGSLNFIYFIILLGVVPNLVQYLFRGPLFGGMSGVVYGLLGFLWMYKKFNKSSEVVELPKHDIYLMVGWFIVCMTGFLGPIANLAHGVGLFIGMLIGLRPFQLEKIKWFLVAFFLISLTIIVELIKLKGVIYAKKLIF